MNEIYEFLKKCGTYYLATIDGDQPRVRPFGTVDIYDGCLTIQTGMKKDVAKQMDANPKVEICAFDGTAWIRLCGKVVCDDSVEAVSHMLDSYPDLKAMYAPGDGNAAVYKFTEGTATITSFTAPPKTIEL